MQKNILELISKSGMIKLESHLKLTDMKGGDLCDIDYCMKFKLDSGEALVIMTGFLQLLLIWFLEILNIYK